MNNTLTYISLFSCAGIGCYGFKQEGFECVATSELIERRLNVQKYNHKCKYESGYICGDITLDETKNKIFNEIDFWKSNENITDIDVVIATPPCQGMSVANTYKGAADIDRNSLVIEAISLVERINPKYFVFENVPAFLDTYCIDMDEAPRLIKIVIGEHLSNKYNINYSILDFAYYGSNSHRKRTLVIGVRKDINVNPKSLFPNNKVASTLRELIGDLPVLNIMGEISATDIYHNFREYNNKFEKEYSNYEDNVDWNSYFDRLNEYFIEFKRILKSGGRAIINVQPNYRDNIPTHHKITQQMIDLDFIWKGEIIWNKNNYNCPYTTWGSWQSPSAPYLKYQFEFVEVFCKDNLKKDGLKENIDITSDEFKTWTTATWNIAPENRMSQFGHPAMFPEELVIRCLKLFSYKNDIILDPFNGCGTTTFIAHKLDRRYIGIDISSDYCYVAEKRIKELDKIKRLF